MKKASEIFAGFKFAYDNASCNFTYDQIKENIAAARSSYERVKAACEKSITENGLMSSESYSLGCKQAEAQQHLSRLEEIVSAGAVRDYEDFSNAYCSINYLSNF
jgi:hypothetical protein